MIRINEQEFKSEEFHNGEVIFERVEVICEDRNIIEMNFKDNKDITALIFARQWLMEMCPNASTSENQLVTIYKDGKMVREQSLADIRNLLHYGKF